jgi:hypothetical protein
MTKTSTVMFAVLIAPAMALATQQRGSSPGCGAPAYRVAHSLATGQALRGLAVSIDPRDVTVGKLMALGCQLEANYPQDPIIEVDIFNDYESARHTAVHAVETLPGSNKAAYIAYYYLNRAEAKETLTLVVDPGHPCGNDIQIDLRNHRVGFVQCK